MSEVLVDWEAVRQVWESDHRAGWVWVKDELGLPVAVQSIRYQAKKYGWVKKPQDYMTALYGPVISTGSQYRKLFAPAAALLALSGHGLADIAATFNVTPELFKEWMNTYPELAEAIQKGSVMADAEVMAALHKVAIGYSQEEQQIVMDEHGKPCAITITKHYPPCGKTAMWWRSNRNNIKDFKQGASISDGVPRPSAETVLRERVMQDLEALRVAAESKNMDAESNKEGKE